MKRPLVIASIGLVLIVSTYVALHLAQQRAARELERELEFTKYIKAIERAEAAEAAVPAIPVSAERRGRYFLNSVFVWNGGVVASMNTKYPPRDRNQRLWMYDPALDEFVPHPLRQELQRVIGGLRSLAIVSADGTSDLVEFNGARRAMLKKNVIVPENSAITFNTRFVFVVSPGSAQAIDATGQVVTSKIDESEITTVEASPNELLVSCDQGEFGATLAAYQIGPNGRLGSRKELVQAHITSSDQDELNNIWMWGIFRHLGMGSSGLYVYPPGGPIRGLRKNGPVERPDAVAIESPGHVLVLSGYKGISRVDARGHVEELWHGRTSIVYRTERVGRATNRDKDTPHSMALLGNRLFVASEGLGVYEFERTADGIRFLRQLHLSPEPAVVPEARR
ncbi:hypothetical protein [Opitutus sp. ER46]|uniref:hypothetical protein n=1 Tax=Opitutus sp. ER46 TaxID=2161864 RepID=UPI000D42E5BC|nr:hypothetical protein [Opitutus sp. ER46]PTX94610.1 hypothetical protein DB354_12835 [Opitutus sp. ER46]